MQWLHQEVESLDTIKAKFQSSVKQCAATTIFDSKQAQQLTLLFLRRALARQNNCFSPKEKIPPSESNTVSNLPGNATI